LNNNGMRYIIIAGEPGYEKICREVTGVSQLIIYGRGLIAEEYVRYLEGQGYGTDVAAFTVTKMNGQGKTYCGRPCIEIQEAIKRYPEADIHLALQEKYHREVIDLLNELDKTPKEIIGLHRMTELLEEQGIREISVACPELTVQRNPHDYSMLELFPHQHPERKFTFYPMTQVPLSEADVRNLRETVAQGEAESLPLEGKMAAARLTDEVYIAMATSQKDARVSQDNLPAYVHPVMGGAAAYDGPRTAEMAYDDEEADNLSPYNTLYSELTVAHWLWKKAPKANYLGLCHYRRHFVLTEAIKAALSAGLIDVLLPRPRLTFPSVRVFFTERSVGHMERLDYETMMTLLGERDAKMEKLGDIPWFSDKPEVQDKVREFAIIDTDPPFIQSGYHSQGLVEGSEEEIRQAFKEMYGEQGYFAYWYFHHYHLLKAGAGATNEGQSYIFPYHLFQEGERTVIYGAGESGQSFYRQLQRQNYLKPAGIVDKRAKKLKTPDLPVQPVEDLKKMDFDAILIAVINEKAAKEIKETLTQMGIVEAKIRWQGSAYTSNDFYQNYYFPLLRKCNKSSIQ